MSAAISAVALNVAEWAIVATTVAFVPAFSLTRLAILPIIVVLAYRAFFAAMEVEAQFIGVFAGTNSFMYLWQYLEAVLLNQWSFEYQGPASSRGGLNPLPPSKVESKRLSRASLWERLCWGAKSMLSPRHPATKFPAKNLPAFSTKNPNWLPSRTSVLAQRFAIVVVCYLLLDALDLSNDPEAGANTFDVRKVPFFSRIREVTMEEITLRYVNVAMIWIVGYIITELLFCANTLFVVGLGFTGVDSFPPIYGSWLDIYSLRSYWGVFWHHNMRRNLESPSHYLTYNLLGLKRGTFVARYLLTLLTFTGSGIIHVGVDYLKSIPPSATGSMVFYPVQALGFVIEDTIQDAWKALFGAPRKGWPKTLAKVAGFIWTVSFMAWSLPAWTYPIACYGSDRPMMPFSPITALKNSALWSSRYGGPLSGAPNMTAGTVPELL